MRRYLGLPVCVKNLTARRTLALAAALTALAPRGHAQTAPPAERFPAALDAYIAGVLEAGRIPGLAIAIVRNDSVLVAKGYGVRELNSAAAVDEHTVFDIASLAKSFTATAAAMLVDRGVLHWDDPVRRHLPYLVLPTPTLTDSATLRDFLSHATGLEAANMMWVPTAVSRQDVLRRMRHVRVVAPFRQTMVYSNIGYTVAGEALAAAAGMPFDMLLRDLVIRPLRLESTTWTYEQAVQLPNVSASHASLDGVQQPLARERQRDAIAPAASVQSSVHDLAQWLRLHLNGGVLDGTRFVSDSALRALHSVQVPIAATPEMRAARMVHDTITGYGLGWQIMDYRGHRLLWHTGNGNGQLAYMALLPEDRLGIVILVNTWSAPLIHLALASRIMDTYLGFEARDWAGEALARVPAIEATQDSARRAMVAMRSTSPPPLPLPQYAGVYDHPVFGPISIAVGDGGLTLRMGAGEVADLEYHGGDTFFTRWRDPFFREFFGAHVTLPAVAGRVDTLRTLLNRDEFTAVRRQTRSQGPSITVAQWREDVRHFARELEKRHRNLFHSLTREAFTREVALLEADVPTLAAHEIVVRLMQLAARVGDAHTSVHMPRWFHVLPVALYWFGDELRVIAAGEEQRAALGTRVVGIGGLGIAEVMTRVTTCFPSARSENEWYVLNASPIFMQRPEVLHALGITDDPARVSFTLEDDDGRRFNVAFPAIALPAGPMRTVAVPGMVPAAAAQPLYRQRAAEPFWFTYLPDSQTVYVAFRGYGDLGSNARRLLQLLDRNPPQRLVIDMRQNDGGDFLQGRRHLVEPIKARATLNQQGRLFVIVGRRTFSAAMANAIDFRTHTAATLVGEPIGERPNSYSENDEFTLPRSRITLSYSTRYYQFLDEDLPAVLPDVRIDPTWPEFRAGRDPVLEWILRQPAAARLCAADRGAAGRVSSSPHAHCTP